MKNRISESIDINDLLMMETEIERTDKKDISKNFDLMLKNELILKLEENVVTVIEQGKLPLQIRGKKNPNYEDLFYWLTDRSTPIERENVKWLLNNLGLSQKDRKSVTIASKALSLIDCYWIKYNEEDTWETVNLYNNKFSEAIGEVAFTGNSNRTIQGDYKTPELTNQGAYAKCWRREDDGIYLIKSNTKEGHEAESEYISHILMDKVGIENVKYEITEYLNRKSSKCKNITDEDISIVPFSHFDTFCSNVGHEPINMVTRYYPKQFSEMLVIDYIIDNIDRHNYNWGLYMDNNTGKILGLHPLLDHNCSLMFKDDEPLSLIYTGKTMKQVAHVHYRRLGEPPFVKEIHEYVNSKEGKELFRKIFRSDKQRRLVSNRCGELLGNI